MGVSMIDNNLIKEMLDAGCAPSAAMLGIMSVRNPLSKETFADKKDREWKKLHRNCQYNIRPNYEKEFANYWPTPFTPPMLVLVIIRFVVWVGTPPYSISPKTDCTVLTILRDFIKRGGANKNSVKKYVKEMLGN
jgi:hypothetical protein